MNASQWRRVPIYVLLSLSILLLLKSAVLHSFTLLDQTLFCGIIFLIIVNLIIIGFVDKELLWKHMGFGFHDPVTKGRSVSVYWLGMAGYFFVALILLLFTLYGVIMLLF
jgi:hypothetical protein